EVPRVDVAPISLPASDDVPLQAGQLAGTTAVCIDNEPAILDGMETLLRGWGCEVIKAADLDTALVLTNEVGPAPNGLLVDYHLDPGNGIAAIHRLRRGHGMCNSRALAPAARPRPLGDPEPRRRLAEGARRAARAKHPSAAQADQ